MTQNLTKFVDDIRSQALKLQTAVKELSADIEKYLNL
jgi:hypothetical protein